MFCLNLSSQNLVPNPDFETYSSCPTSIGQLTNATPWIDPGGSSDYFNPCGSDPFWGVPGAIGGYQNPISGNAYAGIYCYYVNTPTREYLQVQLTDSLIAGECYQVKFYASLLNGSVFGTKNVAAGFSSAAIPNPGLTVINLMPEIFSRNFVSDTLSWVKIEGIYSAYGGEEYLTIGNFMDDLSIDTLRCNPSGWLYGAYYLIEDVSVVAIADIPGGIPASAGTDLTISAGDSVFIGQDISNLNCAWYVGTTEITDSTSGLFVSPSVTTTYIVEQDLCGILTYDTMTVFVSGVGVDENTWIPEISLFPNPNAGKFAVSLSSSACDVLFKVLDVTGREVVSQNVRLLEGLNHFDLEIGDGVYFAQFRNLKSNELVVMKLVIGK